MIGYSAIEKAIADKWVVKRVFVYIDASPHVKSRQGIPLGVVVITPDEQPDKLRFDKLAGMTVHVDGSDKERVYAFADKIERYRPRKMILNWHEAMEIRQ
jgi:hypothetical protein